MLNVLIFLISAALTASAHARVRELACEALLDPKMRAPVRGILAVADRVGDGDLLDARLVSDLLHQRNLVRWERLRPDPFVMRELTERWSLAPAEGPKVFDRLLVPTNVADALEKRYAEFRSNAKTATERRILAYYFILAGSQKKFSSKTLVTVVQDLFGGGERTRQTFRGVAARPLNERLDLLAHTLRFLNFHWDQHRADGIGRLSQLLSRALFMDDDFPPALLAEALSAYLDETGVQPTDRAGLGNLLAAHVPIDRLLELVRTGRVKSLDRIQELMFPEMGEPALALEGVSPATWANALIEAIPNCQTFAAERLLLEMAEKTFAREEAILFSRVLEAFAARDRTSPERVRVALEVFSSSQKFKGGRFVADVMNNLPSEPTATRALLDVFRREMTGKDLEWWMNEFSSPVQALLKDGPQPADQWTLDFAAWLYRARRTDAYVSFVWTAVQAEDWDRVAEVFAALSPVRDEDAQSLIHSLVYEGGIDHPRLRHRWLALYPKLTPEWQSHFKSVTQSVLAQMPPLSRAAERQFGNVIPLRRDSPIPEIFTAPPRLGQPIPVARILEGMARGEVLVREKLDAIVKANKPPEGQSWMTLLEGLPLAGRREYAKKLMARNSSNTEKLSRVIAKLEPIDGVREAVQEFLAQSSYMDSNRSDFEREEVARMFKGDRFRRFFPQTYEGAQVDDGLIRTQFVIGVRTTPVGRGLRTDWLIEKTRDENLRGGVHGALGFKPAVSYNRMRRTLASNFTGEHNLGESGGVRGFVVQGAYERQGYSLMAEVRRQGDMHVEQEVEPFNAAIEESLRNGSLSRQPPLIQRLFVYNWALNTDPSLIETIRQRAIAIAERDKSFFDLRVQVHNFPNADVLARVEQFHQRYRDGSSVKDELGTLVEEIRRLLRRGSSGHDTWRDAVAGLPALGETTLPLDQWFGDFQNLNGFHQIQRLTEVRAQWMLLSVDPAHERGHTDGYAGDRTLSDFAQALIAKQIETFLHVETIDEARRFVALAKLILEHVERDNWLSSSDGLNLRHALGEVSIRDDLAPAAMVEAASALISNAINQVHARATHHFGKFDDALWAISRAPHAGVAAPAHFIDEVMRTSNVFMLSRLVERLRHADEVYNSGRAIGTLRFDPSPDQIRADDIVVFTKTPAEIPPVAGIITLASGSSLSHLQLLAKSIGIPNAKLAADRTDQLRGLDGERVVMIARADGNVTEVSAIGDAAPAVNPHASPRPPVKPSAASHAIDRPLDFDAAAAITTSDFAGPKGLQLARLRAKPATRDLVPDGVILPFGFFAKYARVAKIRPLLRLLGYVDLRNELMVAKLLADVRSSIDSTEIPTEMMDEVSVEVARLRQRTGALHGMHVRSDTNFEDLPGFNGAGLNESVPNVPVERADLERAIRRVWSSTFAPRAVMWRSVAARSVRAASAEPSVVIQPTVAAVSSGVILSRGGPDMTLGRGRLNADWGIGSVVNSRGSVEEIDFSSGSPVRVAFSISRSRPVIDQAGGLKLEEAQSGQPVLNQTQQIALNSIAQLIDQTLGDAPRGWDIEWAITADSSVRIVQARPAF